MVANSSTARSGELGKAVVDDDLILRLKNWTLNSTVSETAWGDSDSGKFTNRKGARKDATGTITGAFDDTKKIYDLFVPDDIVKLVLWETATDYWVFPCALIQSYNQTFDQDSKEVVEWNSDWGADGIFYYPGEAGAPTETLPSS